MMLELGQKTSAWALGINAAWAWLSDNANGITAVCAVGGLVVNLVFTYLRYKRGDRKV